MTFQRNQFLQKRIVNGAGYTWQTTVKGGRALGASLLGILALRDGGLTRGWVQAVFRFAKLVVSLQDQGGWRFVVIYLKACLVLLQQAASGQKTHSAQALGCAVARTKAGLPRVIPAAMRKRIRSGDVWTIRIYLSLFQLYRVIDIKGKLKLSTITKPPTVKVGWLQGWIHFLTHFAPIFFERVGYAKSAALWTRSCSRNPENRATTIGFLGNNIYAWIEDECAAVYPNEWRGVFTDLRSRFLAFRTSGPNSSKSVHEGPGPSGRTSTHTIITDAMMLLNSSLRVPVMEWMDIAGGGCVSKILSDAPGVVDEICSRDDMDPELPGGYVDRRGSGPHYPRPIFGFGACKGLGKLGFSTEPAGKVRVFAMVDSLTQMLMAPLHKRLFECLAKIPQDGTFDQLKPAKVLLDLGHRKFWCYDLSAATDRFPASLQQAVLGLVIGPRLARLWIMILKDRDYSVPRTIPSVTKGRKGTKVPKGTPLVVRYHAGQPMGALTSWAAFSLSHHILVQYAAFKAFGSLSWFSEYALLGDDIAIANKTVAEVYINLLQEIGVEYGLAKSLISSSGGLEFAKRTFVHGQDVSPISLQALGVAKADHAVLEDILVRAGIQGFNKALVAAARVLGYGYRARARLPVVLESRTRLQGLSILLSRPKSPFGEATFERWLYLTKRDRPAILSQESKATIRESVWERIWTSTIKSYEGLMESLLTWSARVAVAEDSMIRPVDAQALARGIITTGNSGNQSLVTGLYTRFVISQIKEPWIESTFEGFEEVMSIIEQMRPLAGREGDINDAWLMLSDLRDRIASKPRSFEIGIRDQIDFGANKRSAIVRLWRAIHKLVLRLEAQDVSQTAASDTREVRNGNVTHNQDGTSGNGYATLSEDQIVESYSNRSRE